jgi:predicted permease
MRLYSLLLHLYPAGFRNEYGAEMTAVFTRRLRDAASLLATLWLWLETIADTLVSAAAAHGDILRQDLRYTARAFAQSPAFAVTAILIVALGVGANTAAFTVADYVLVRPLPFYQPDRLVKLWEDMTYFGYSRNDPSPPNFRDWRRLSRSFESMAAWHSLSANFVGDATPERFDGVAATAELLPMLGVHPLIGRWFTSADDAFQAPATVLLSNSLWTERYGADPAVLGRKVLVNGEPCTVIGVMPPGFRFPGREAAFWMPARFGPDDYSDRRNSYLRVIARLKPGVTFEQARAEMKVIGRSIEREYPKDMAHVGVTVIHLRDEISWRSRLLLTALLGAALCVLLIACTNLGNLLLSRALIRRKELAVRLAIGAGPDRVIRQLLTENVVISLLGGLLGLAIAVATVPMLTRLIPANLPMAETPRLDLRLLLIGMLTTSAAGLGFGIIPAIRACRVGSEGLREGARQGAGGRSERLRSILVIAEVTISVVLIVSTGLFLRALVTLQDVDPGFRTDVLTLRTTLPQPKYESTASRVAFYRRVLSEVRALPGVQAAGYSSYLPLTFRGGVFAAIVPGESADKFSPALLRFVTPDFFATLGIRLLSGRDFAESDSMTAPWVAVVSESFTRDHWPGQNPLGKHFKIAEAGRTIVGVVKDIHIRGIEQASEPQVYLPYQQVPDGWFAFHSPKDLAVRASGNVASLAPALRRIVSSADPQQPVSDVRMLSAIVAAETAPRLVQVRVLGAFALVAFILAGVGLHGVLSFAVSQRFQEIGIRIALGATPANILRLVVSQGLALAGAGIALGLLLAYFAGRSMQAMLAGVSPADASVIVAGVMLCLTMALAGTAIPAWRALRVDPITAIRVE